jgi:glycosyltransferase involved in cell wall biosynthesis
MADMTARGLVRLLGHVDDMPSRLSTIDIAVLPTRYAEGVPRILIEAAAVGLPLVTTDAPGCREIVVHGSNGFLVPPGDVSALTSAVQTLLEHPELRASMGHASRERAEQFSEPRVIHETFLVYGKALGLASGAEPCHP